MFTSVPSNITNKNLFLGGTGSGSQKFSPTPLPRNRTVLSKTMSSTSTDTYLLSRGSFAATRLNCQHYIWGRELGFTIDPTVALPNTNPRIADVATGTGVWLLEAASLYPGARCDGTDIDLSQAPPSKWCPPNVAFSRWDFRTTPPEEWHGVYDLVHVRLVMLAIEKDPSTVIQNLSMLLKPGGCLQWEELDVTQTRIEAVEEGVSTTAMEMMVSMMIGKKGIGWVLELPVLLEREGLGEVTTRKIMPDMALLRSYSMSHLPSWVEIAQNLVEGSQERQGIEKMMKGVAAEIGQGAAFGIAKTVTLARRASS